MTQRPSVPAFLLKNQSLTRILMNDALRAYTLRGRTVDIGGGHSPDYFTYFQKAPDFSLEMIDGSKDSIDFEKDRLPFADASIDTVILCNVLEHIFNYQHLLREVRRILKEDGQLIGFVPFWMGYHPDPHDYFRYTHEALTRMFAEAGFSTSTLSPLGGGPFLANFNTIVLSTPRILRPVLYVLYSMANTLFLHARPGSAIRQPLGYIFHA